MEKYKSFYKEVIDFKKSRFKLFLVIEVIYIAFLLYLLFTSYWFVGLAILILAFVFPKNDELTDRRLAVDSTLTILLLSIVIVM